MTQSPEVGLGAGCCAPTIPALQAKPNTETPLSLCEAVMVENNTFFTRCGHKPSPSMVNALEDVARTIQDMAEGSAEPVYYLSALDPGVGKTRTLASALKVLVGDKAYADVGVIVFLSRRSEIEVLVREIGLARHAFAVMTSDQELNSIGSENAGSAQVLFTTQQRLEVGLEKMASFEAMHWFHYRGRARPVRVWDESAIPGKVLTVDQYDLGYLFGSLGKSNPELATAIDKIKEDVMQLQSGEVYSVPDFAAEHGVSLEDAKRILKGNQATSVLSSLWYLSGRPVTIRREGHKKVFLDYHDLFTDDLAPMLILDASGRVRETYRVWELGRRGNLRRLRTASKRYDNLTVRVWNRSGGKTAWRNDATKLIDGIVRAINTRATEDWLIITHKVDTIGRPRAQEEIRARFRGSPSLIKFIEWGRHTATNEHVSVKNVILAGLLYVPRSAIEATGRAAAGLHTADGVFSYGDIREIEKGEHLHNILQALCRGHVRRCEGDKCGICRAYIIVPIRSGVQEALPKVFPGCRVEPWEPLGDLRKLTARQQRSLAAVERLVGESPAALVPFSKVANAAGILDPREFRKAIRSDSRFKAELTRLGIIELSRGRGRSGFIRAAESYRC